MRKEQKVKLCPSFFLLRVTKNIRSVSEHMFMNNVIASKSEGVSIVSSISLQVIQDLAMKLQ